MSTLIVYASKSGAAKTCAEALSRELGDCRIVDAASAPSPEGWDTVVLGSGVRMGKIYKPLAKYITRHAQALETQRLALFLCNGDLNTFAASLEKNLPASLRDHALAAVCLGGKPPFSKTPDDNWLLRDNLDALVQAIKGS